MLSCGNNYTFSVRAVINDTSGTEKTANISLQSDVGAVVDLAVSVISFNKSQESDRAEGGFLLTWNKPKNVDVSEIEVSVWRLIFCLIRPWLHSILGFKVTSRPPCWCTEQWRKKVFWEFDAIIMQNLSDTLPLFCILTWLSGHVSENCKLNEAYL